MKNHTPNRAEHGGGPDGITTRLRCVMFGANMESKWESKSKQKVIKKQDRFQEAPKGAPGSQNGAKIEPKWKQHGANMEDKMEPTLRQTKIKVEATWI